MATSKARATKSGSKHTKATKRSSRSKSATTTNTTLPPIQKAQIQFPLPPDLTDKIYKVLIPDKNHAGVSVADREVVADLARVVDESMQKYCKKYCILSDPISEFLTGKMAHCDYVILLMFFILGLEYKGMTKSIKTDLDVIIKGARKFIRTMANRRYASRVSNNTNVYPSAMYYLCVDLGLIHLMEWEQIDMKIIDIWNLLCNLMFYKQFDGAVYTLYVVGLRDPKMNNSLGKYHWISVRIGKNCTGLRSAMNQIINQGYTFVPTVSKGSAGSRHGSLVGEK